MKRYSRGVEWKKKRKRLCFALMAALLIGGAYFVQGEAAPPARAEEETSEESGPSDEKLEGETGASGIESAEPETTGREIAEGEIPENDIEISELGISETENSDLESTETDFSEPTETETETSGQETGETEVQQAVQPVGEASGSEEITCLQIPEKLEIVINPWEMDGKGQIYSEPFVVRNMGNVPGIVTVSFTCKVNEKEGAELRETREGLHDSGEKLIYMKAAFGNGEGSVFTRGGAQCQAKLQPGEELSLWFEGEVNENASEPWKSEDIEIEGRYSWEEEEIPRGEDGGSGSETGREATGENGLSENRPEEE